DEAERVMVGHKVKKLPLVESGGRLLGLITARDISKHRRQPFATRDAQGRLRVSAAIGATGDYLERAAELIRAEVDVIVIDIADGGISRDGALALALLFGGDTAMLSSAFAGTLETPGEIVHKPVVLPEGQRTVRVPFKVLRGMASIGAIKDRLDVEDAAEVDL